MSIRLRLTLLYSTILTLTLIALGVVLYVTVSQVTVNTIETTLVEKCSAWFFHDRSGSITLARIHSVSRCRRPIFKR